MVCFPDIRPGGVGGAAHRMRPCGQAHRDFRRRKWYASLTTGPAELAAPHIECVPVDRPIGILAPHMVCFPDNRPGGVGGAAHRLRPCEQALRAFRRRTWYASFHNVLLVSKRDSFESEYVVKHNFYFDFFRPFELAT